MVGGGWFLPCLSNWVSLFCLYPWNRLCHRAGIGPILKLRQLSFRWDQPQLCSFIRLGVITKNVIYTANVPYTHILIVYIYCFAYISRTNWATELGLVPNESPLIKVFRHYIIYPFLFIYSRIISKSLRKFDGGLKFFGQKFILFCLYLRNELSYRAGIGPKWKLFV